MCQLKPVDFNLRYALTLLSDLKGLKLLSSPSFLLNCIFFIGKVDCVCGSQKCLVREIFMFTQPVAFTGQSEGLFSCLSEHRFIPS